MRDLMLQISNTEEATGIVNAAGERSRWGKLKSGQGWIYLDYAEKVA